VPEVREEFSFPPSAAAPLRQVQVPVLEPAEIEIEEEMICLRCKSPMYQVVGVNGAKETCSGCSQYVDCARCSNAQCGDTKCLSCYNKAVTPGSAKRFTPGQIVPEDQEL
jgi:hypothetical protein